MKRLELAPPHPKLHSDRVVPELPNQIDERIEHQVVREPGSLCLVEVTAYNASVSATGNAKVSHRGQTSLPAELRHRWGIAGGGEVGFIDLGDAALIVPGGVAAARSELRRVLEHRYDVGLASIADPEIADQ
jgi:bifunctional DNA-binding transcriptional regulator/antitoxin component of YhaV-PrlF toxin-antitoxin module